MIYIKGSVFLLEVYKRRLSEEQGIFPSGNGGRSQVCGSMGIFTATVLSLGFEGYAPSTETLPPAKEATKRALTLDPASSHVHLAMGGIYLNEWNWSRAEAEMKKAIELDPNRAENRRIYSRYFRSIAKWNEAIEEAKKARELDPLSVVNARSLENAYFWGGQYDLAIEQYLAAVE